MFTNFIEWLKGWKETFSIIRENPGIVRELENAYDSLADASAWWWDQDETSAFLWDDN